MGAESRSNDDARITLVLGGARSGKSRYAETLIGRFPDPLYLATAEAGDAEMSARIALHRKRRGSSWRTVEEPLELAQTLERHADTPVLVDCLTLWLSNLMMAGRDPNRESERLIAALGRASAPVALVSNEVGLGIVPETPLGRRFRDEAGRLNQAVAAAADRVVFMAAGLPMVLKA